jgi:glycosyltransferase involved in cell wall biosynthesis
MHIAFWSPAWPLAKFQNGIITYVHWMKREFEREGHRVSVFTTGLDASTNEPGVYDVPEARPPLLVRAYRQASRPWRPQFRDVFEFSREIAQHVLAVHRRDPIDIIEMEESFGWFADVARRTSIPLLVKLHGPAFLSLVDDELNSPFGREKIDREGDALRTARVIVAPSESTLTQTIERYSLAPLETRRIVNPLTMDERTPLWRLKSCDRNTILFVGRFDLRKGGDIVLKAFLSALEVRPDLKLVFVGPDRGLPASDGTRIHFKPYCDSLFPAELRDRVDFRGPLSNDAIAELRTQAMVTLVASRWESQGYTVLEAMFQGCPLVSTDAGGVPETVTNGVTGLLAKSGDPSAFAVQLGAMCDDPEGAAAMGEAARRHVLDQHAPNKIAEETLDMYSRVILGHGR